MKKEILVDEEIIRIDARLEFYDYVKPYRCGDDCEGDYYEEFDLYEEGSANIKSGRKVILPKEFINLESFIGENLSTRNKEVYEESFYFSGIYDEEQDEFILFEDLTIKNIRTILNDDKEKLSKILNKEDFSKIFKELDKKITLDDIKEGMILTLRSGEDIIILDNDGSFYTTVEGDVKKDNESFYLLFNDDLTHGQVGEFDILKVKDKTGEVLFDITNKNEGKPEDEDELDRY